MYLLCIYKYTHIHYILKIFTCIYMFLYIFYIIYKYKQNIFLKYIHACVCIYIYIINTDSIHILCKQKLLFWMWLIPINHLTALMYVYIQYIYKTLDSNFYSIFVIFLPCIIQVDSCTESAEAACNILSQLVNCTIKTLGLISTARPSFMSVSQVQQKHVHP